MTHIPDWCGICKGRTPRYFCKTENLYICDQCNSFCHRMAHNWKELEMGIKIFTSSTSDGSSRERTYKGPGDKQPTKTKDGSSPHAKGKGGKK